MGLSKSIVITFRTSFVLILAMLLASFIVSIFSFFVPFANINDYTWSHIFRYEFDYMYLTFYGFLFMSLLMALPLIVLNSWLLQRFSLRGKTASLKLVLPFFNTLVILVGFYTGWYILQNPVAIFYTYMVPVYGILTFAASWLIIPK